MKMVCPQHGRIVRVGFGEGKHCPICGKKCFRVLWIPRLYIDKAGSIIIGSAIALTAFFVFAVPAMVRSSAEEDRNSKSKIDAMPPAWRSLYFAVQSVSFGKSSVVTAFAFSHSPAELPPLDAEDMKIIIDQVSEEKTNAANALTPYLKTK